MEEKHPRAAEEIEEEIRLVNEQIARIEVSREAGNPSGAPPRLPDIYIPPHIRSMSLEGLSDHLDRLTRDLEQAQSGWQTEVER